MSQRQLRTIVFALPTVASPSGGMKMLCRHCEIIDQTRPSGVEALISFPADPDFKLDWFEGTYRIKRDGVSDPTADLVMLPEILVEPLAPMLKSAGMRYGIYVQNAFYVLNGAMPRLHRIRAVRSLYEDATVVVSISDEITANLGALFPQIVGRVRQIQYSFDTGLFNAASPKQNLLAFMPRKQQFHVQHVVSRVMLAGYEGWELAPIEGMSEQRVAETLRASRIFLSFSDLEGFGMPPVEAALAGNLVIGYTGEGGKEYWHKPLFTEIRSGDLVGFAAAVTTLMRQLRDVPPEVTVAELAEARAALADRYSRQRELAALHRAVADIADLFAQD